MPRFEITAPDGRRFEVNAPDGASQDDVLAYAQTQFKKVEPDKPVSPLDSMSGTDKFLAGAGKAMVDVGRGLGQRIGLVDEKDVAESRKRDAPLMDSGAGTAGNIAGNVAAFLPAAFVPGANTVAGAAIIGGATGAARPTAEGESALSNVALGAGLGGASQWGFGKLADIFGKRLMAVRDEELARKARNAVKDTAVAESRDLGYQTIPSVSGGNLPGRIVEGLTGKEKATQLASVKNQPVTDALVRRAMGLADDAPLSKETMRDVRKTASAAGYDPIRQIHVVETDKQYAADITKLTSRADNASADFGALVESDVKPLAEGLKEIKAFGGSQAVDAISIFREKASDLYAQGNKTLDGAYRKAAEAIENQVERSLESQGKDGAKVLKDFRDARTKMAQSFDVEKAVREGQGVVDARVIGRLYQKAPDRMSGELAAIGKAAAAMPEVMGVPKAGWSNPVTALDSGVGTIGSIMSGNPMPLAYPAARAAARYALFTGPGQRALATPRYGPGPVDTGAAALLEALRQRGAGALVPASIYAPQE